MKNKLLLLIVLLTGILTFSSSAFAAEDVGVSAILSPSETVVLNSQYSLKSVVFNIGTQASTFDVVFTIAISGSSVYEVADTVTITDMAAGTIDTVDFTRTFTPTTENTFDVISYTVLATDENNSNDETSFQAETHHGLAVWYGNTAGTPIQVNINSRVSIDAFAQTNSDVHVADCHLCMGVNMTYIDSLLSRTEGTYYYPFTEWDGKEFFHPDYGQPAMPEGFGSQSFQGYANLIDPFDAPFLHSEVPVRILTYVVKTANDSSIIGATAEALVPGNNRIQGPSNAGDSTGGVAFDIYESFAPFYVRGAGKIRGLVTDQDDIPLPNVEVIDINSSKTTYTGPDGRYELADLFPGSHDISFSHPSQRDTVVTGVIVTPNSTRTLNVKMQVLPFHDVGVTAIISPPAFVQQNVEYALKSEVANMGTATSSFDVVFEAYILGNATPIVVDTFAVTDLAGGAVDTVTFGETITTTLDTTYEFTSYSLLAEDIDASNDTSYSSSSIFFGVNAWYGNIESTPLPGNLGDRLTVDVYMQTVEDIYLAFAHLCLGAQNRYIDSLLSKDEGTVYYPFTEWDIAQFTSPQGTPPNPDGWSSQSFIGFSSIGSQRNPWLHHEAPEKVLSYVVKIVNDPLLVGDTVSCFGPGLNTTFGASSASDTLARNSYPIIELFSPVYFKAVGFIAGTVLDVTDQPIEGVTVTAIGSDVTDTTDIYGEYLLDSLTIGIYDVLFSHPIYRDTTVAGVEVRLRETTIIDMVLSFPCHYKPGDINSDGQTIGSDVVYAVNYFRGIIEPPPDSCFNTNNDTWLYSAGDVNGDCSFNGTDITYLVNYFRGMNTLQFCQYTPPPAVTSRGIITENIKIPINQPDASISMETEAKQ